MMRQFRRAQGEKMKLFMPVFLIALMCVFTLPSNFASAQDQSVINLPAPEKNGGMPLMDALAIRRSTRSFSPEPLSLQHLSNILWCAFGVNRPDGKRTIPTAMNKFELLVYAVLPEGVYLYDPGADTLSLALSGDRTKDYGGAPLTLLYAGANKEDQFGDLHAGAAFQSAALYCAANDLANVVKITGINNLKGELEIPNDWQVLIVQSIGHMAE
jgi:hypothetical protein